MALLIDNFDPPFRAGLSQLTMPRWRATNGFDKIYRRGETLFPALWRFRRPVTSPRLQGDTYLPVLCHVTS